MTAAPVIQEAPDETIIVEGFGDDALGRVQGLLFGDHAQRTNDRIESIERTLCDMINELRTTLEVQLSQLADQLSHETDARERAVDELGARVDQEVKLLAKADTSLARKLDKTAESLRNRVVATADKAATELATVKQELATDIAAVQGTAVERTALATLLRATANDLDA